MDDDSSSSSAARRCDRSSEVPDLNKLEDAKGEDFGASRCCVVRCVGTAGAVLSRGDPLGVLALMNDARRASTRSSARLGVVRRSPGSTDACRLYTADRPSGMWGGADNSLLSLRSPTVEARFDCSGVVSISVIQRSVKLRQRLSAFLRN